MSTTFTVDIEQDETTRELRLRGGGLPRLVGWCEGGRTYLAEGDEAIGRLDYAVVDPVAGLLAPWRPYEWEAPLELRGSAGRMFQPRASMLWSRWRAVVVELGDRRYRYWWSLGRFRLEREDGTASVRARVRDLAGSADGTDLDELLEVFMLLATAAVARHLTALSV